MISRNGSVVIDGHFDRPIANNVSVFTISQDWLKQILQSKKVVSSSVIPIAGGQFKRIVDIGINIGQTSLKQGGYNTSWLTVYTDKAGNLISTYPVAKPVTP